MKPFIFLLSKFIAYHNNEISHEALYNMKQLEFCDDDTKVEYNGKIPYYKKAKNSFFVELDFESAYMYFHKAIESYDNSINSLEMLMTLTLNYRGGTKECFELLKEFKWLFFNINDYKKHVSKITSIDESSDDSEEALRIVIESVEKEYNIEYPMLKEISFRESLDHSYIISNIYQIFIDKNERDESKFISNEALKQEQKCSKGSDKNIQKKYHCYRMMYFYNSESAQVSLILISRHTSRSILQGAATASYSTLKHLKLTIYQCRSSWRTNTMKN